MAQANFPSISADAKVYSVIVSTSSVDICRLDASKDSWIIRNVGTVPVYFKYGENCNPVIYTHKINPNTIFSDNYGGHITGCVDGPTPGILLVTVKI